MRQATNARVPCLEVEYNTNLIRDRELLVDTMVSSCSRLSLGRVWCRVPLNGCPSPNDTQSDGVPADPVRRDGQTEATGGGTPPRIDGRL